MKDGYKIILDADDLFECPLIIKWPTGINYTCQTDGLGCSHPIVEGFVIDLGGLLDGFDDCRYGCNHISDKDFNKLPLAHAIDDYLIQQTEGQKFTLSFDFNNIDQLMEGWWPVIFNGEWKGLRGIFSGILSEGNCD